MRSCGVNLSPSKNFEKSYYLGVQLLQMRRQCLQRVRCSFETGDNEPVADIALVARKHEKRAFRRVMLKTKSAVVVPLVESWQSVFLSKILADVMRRHVLAPTRQYRSRPAFFPTRPLPYRKLAEHSF